MASSMRMVQRTLNVYRHTSVLQPTLKCALVSPRVQYRSFTTKPETATTNGNGEKAPETKEESPDQKAISKLKQELEESKHETLLAIAERQTSMRIAREDVRKAKEFGIQKFASTLFDVNDTLERALDAVKPEQLANNEDLKNFYEGVQMTEKLLIKAYEQNEIKRFNPMGEKFDPNKHQALQEVVDPSKEPGTVCYVMKAGYQLKDRVIRAAAVAVVKADPNAPKAGEKEPAAKS